MARRHGLTPQQLFAWRRQARVTTDEDGLSDGPGFLPAIVAAVEPPVAEDAEPVRRRGRPRGRKASGVIEVEIGGATVRVGRGAEAKAVTAILLALKVQP